MQLLLRANCDDRSRLSICDDAMIQHNMAAKEGKRAKVIEIAKEAAEQATNINYIYL